MTNYRVSAPRSEGVGLKLPERDPAHEHPQWYELDHDDSPPFEEDAEFVDPLPTERHRIIPDWPY